MKITIRYRYFDDGFTSYHYEARAYDKGTFSRLAVSNTSFEDAKEKLIKQMKHVEPPAPPEEEVEV